MRSSRRSRRLAPPRAKLPHADRGAAGSLQQRVGLCAWRCGAALAGGCSRRPSTTRSACSSMCNFQHRVSEVLEGHGVASYTGIDDVGLHAQTFDQYLDHLETKWSTDKQECFAIVRADTHFDSAWIVHHFTAETIPVQMWEAEGELASVVEALARRHGAPRTRFWSSAV